MGGYRSKSYADDRIQMDKHYEPQFSNDFRSYSASYASSVGAPPLPPLPPQQNKLKKGKSTSGSTSKSWSFNDPEFQRKRRVASYKVYSVEGKVKGSFRRSFRWLKDKYTQLPSPEDSGREMAAHDNVGSKRHRQPNVRLGDVGGSGVGVGDYSSCNDLNQRWKLQIPCLLHV
ncbi:hypothetical protein CQW23_29816 [Capsicum baccatum]|uniref:DUF3511 domain-containing protein n=1 Tax=Capsicum baccatum TaxID=33114 RepID=A0A2G2VC77_CAPBA|nr:hypothetical protein CQW23_29816 [Capsicum baccatum]